MQRTDSLEKTLIWERLKVGEGDSRGWDGWIASPIWWTWVWASSRSSWWTGKPGVLQSMGLQRFGHNWATKLNWMVNHVVARVRFFFALHDWIILQCMYIHILFIHSSINGHLGRFYLSALVNNAAVNMGVQIYVSVHAFNSSGYVPRSAIARSNANSVFNFLKNCYTVFHGGYTILHSHQ